MYIYEHNYSYHKAVGGILDDIGTKCRHESRYFAAPGETAFIPKTHV